MDERNDMNTGAERSGLAAHAGRLLRERGETVAVAEGSADRPPGG